LIGSEPPFTVRVESRNGVARVVPSGDLDVATVPVLNDHLAQTEQDGVRAIMLDLRFVTFLGGSGIRAFLQARDRAALNGHRFLMVRASPFTRHLLQVTSMDFLLDDPDAVSALDLFSRSAPHARLSDIPANLDA
jgi:anti-anti-sigma factor